jgi:AcrR family transcriptional regulator
VGKGSAMRDTVRYGRPPKELAGEVEERILDAAREVFLNHGFGGASIDEIAAVARSAKTTIYTRFPNKRALFTAVVMRDIVSRISQFKIEVPTGATIEERFASAGVGLLRWTLVTERFRLMRLAIAEAHQFPDLASTVRWKPRIPSQRRQPSKSASCSCLVSTGGNVEPDHTPYRRRWRGVLQRPRRGASEAHANNALLAWNQ